MRIDRMLSIIVLLLNKERVSARELAEKFEISIRTVYRDIDAINMAGIPIISYSGNNGGFGIMENYKIDRRLLSLNDILAILSALKGINTTLEDRELDSAIEKIASLVPREKAGELELYFEQFVIDILPWGYRKKQKEILKLIQKSIISNNIIAFTYRNYLGENYSRTVEPMTLLFKGYAWYLFAYCRVKCDFRLFRLSRMRSVTSTDQSFQRRKASYQDFTGDEDKNMKAVKLVLRFTSGARGKVEDYFDDDQIETMKNGDIIVRASFPEDEWIYSFLLSYGENVEVLEPPHIRAMIDKKAKKISNIYKRGR